MATSLSPACEAANRQALQLLTAQQTLQAQEQLAQFAAHLGESAGDRFCLAVTLNNSSSVLNRLGRRSEGEEAAKRAVHLFEETAGENTPLLRYPLLSLAQSAIERGEFARAEKLLARAAGLPAPDHKDLAIENGLKARLLIANGDLKGAEVAYRLSIAEREQAGQGASLEAVPELFNLGVLYVNQGQPAEGVHLLERALHIAEAFPSDTQSHVETLLALGVARAKNKDTKNAETDFQLAIQLLDLVPASQRGKLGRNAYTLYSSFLLSTNRKRKATVVANEGHALFGPDPSTMVVSVDSFLPNHQ